MMTVFEATTDTEYQEAAGLFQEYAAAIGIDLEFQDFNKEVAKIRAHYQRPLGALFLVRRPKGEASGCVAIRPLEGSVCELKRMYLRPGLRGSGAGRMMLQKALSTALELGYTHMRLDTLSSMKAAIGLYTHAGFYEIEAYRYNPFPTARFFEIALQTDAGH